MTIPADPTRIVITGCGTINAVGRDVAEFWSALVADTCGLRPAAGTLEPPGGQVGAVADEALPLPDGPEPLSRTDRLAWVAAREAVRQSRLNGGGDDRVGIVVGTTTGGIREVEQHVLDRSAGRPAPRSRLLLIEKPVTADLLAIELGFAGPRRTVLTACASGASAIIVGAQLIRAGRCDAVLAGGSDSLTRITITGFASLRAVDPRRCRPFDRDRAGLSLGEGAGMVVLERADRARARRAEVLAELLGAAQTTDGHHLTQPRPDGAVAARAMREALRRAGLEPEQVDHVNAHGTGTPANDLAEARAIHEALGPHAAGCPVTSIKGSVGHTLGAAGAIDAVAAIQTLRSGVSPPTTGLERLDPQIELEVVRSRARRGEFRTVLSNSFGFGGSNAVLCLGRETA